MEENRKCEMCGGTQNIIELGLHNGKKIYGCLDCIMHSRDNYHGNDMKNTDTFYKSKSEIDKNIENYYGFELETELVNNRSFNKLIEEGILNTEGASVLERHICYGSPLIYIGAFVARILLKDFGAVVEYDGSLCNGMEIITAPFSKQYGRDKEIVLDYALKELCRLGFNRRDTTGLHIHTSRTEDMDEDFVAKLWIPFLSFDIDTDSFCERGDEHYCQRIDDLKDRVLPCGCRDCSLSNDRYYMINNTNENTVEYRAFKSTMNAKRIMMYIDFIEHCIRTVEQGKKFTTLKALVSKRYHDMIKDISNGRVKYILKSQISKIVRDRILGTLEWQIDRRDMLEELHCQDIYTNRYMASRIYHKYMKNELSNSTMKSRITRITNKIKNQYGI